ncbi:hypothetical protein [uncultured Roseobacter sp.]|uniref:hypothetical protein n=1 Tax=uncultured Roseobacter sp. TaxID=114847 RepID=UPI00260FE885|nr:hypothetical protein [uncultured Roseobacter sp.]
MYIVDIFYGPGRPSKAFIHTVIYITAIGLIGAIFQYVVWVEGFGKQLREDDFARLAFARQVLTTGVPMVPFTNLVAGMVYAVVRNTGGGRVTGLQYFMLDLIVRFVVFAASMAGANYVAAVAFGFFDGDVERALGADWPTLAIAFCFGNLTSAFILAALLGDVPIFTSAAVDLSERFSVIRHILRNMFSHLPLSDKPVLITSVAFAILAYLVFQFGAYTIAILNTQYPNGALSVANCRSRSFDVRAAL